MHIFGITGPIGHGKTTLANALMILEHPAVHMETSMIIGSVANEWFATFNKNLLIDPINYNELNLWLDELARVVSNQIRPIDAYELHITHEQVLNEPKYVYKLFMHLNLIRQGVIALGESITEENKDRHRTILQWIGGFLVHRIDPGIWYEEIERRIKVAESDGILLYVVGGLRYPHDAEIIKRNGGKIIKLLRSDIPERELDDITEEHRNEIVVDTTIISDATPDALNEVVKAMYNDYLLGDLLTQYNSDDFQAMV
jgi:hypothetical protein